MRSLRCSGSDAEDNVIDRPVQMNAVKAASTHSIERSIDIDSEGNIYKGYGFVELARGNALHQPLSHDSRIL